MRVRAWLGQVCLMALPVAGVLLWLPGGVWGAGGACTGAKPDAAAFAALFQREIDATEPFVLETVMVEPPDGWEVSLVYVARDLRGTMISINPTLVAAPGSTLRFALQDCLAAADIERLVNYDPLDEADPGTPEQPGVFHAVQAMEMKPTGYMNLHTHGLHGRPLAGTPERAAGDEVLTTFVAPFGKGAEDGSVSDRQEYRIRVPDDQDPGLYWYHPHIHGEAQPQVFLGLTGAIVVVPKRTGDSSGAAAIGAEVAAHRGASAAPAVYVVRDYPVEHFRPAAGGVHAAEAVAEHRADAAEGVRPRRSRRHRSRFLAGTPGVRTPAAPDLDGAKAEANPLCTLFRAPGTGTPCLPDVVSAPADAEAPSLATLVTVNGRVTETPDGPGDPQALLFQPLIPEASDRVLRVLNASANTYVRLGLSPKPLNKVELREAATTDVPTVKLVQLRRDGAPVRRAMREVDTILLPPGGRAEFRAKRWPQAGSLALVSTWFDTGGAGDRVPPRTLARLAGGVSGQEDAMGARSTGARSAVEAAAVQDEAAETSRRFAGAYQPATGRETRRAFAFFEWDRNCPAPKAGQPEPDCGTTFYLMDITRSAIGVDGQRTSVAEAVPFAMPMMPGGGPSRDLFDANGRIKPETPSLQVALHGQHEIDEEWDVYNFTGEAHAFHVHQLGYGVEQACSPRTLLAATGSANCLATHSGAGDANREAGLLLDVINVPPGYAQASPDARGTAVVYPGHVRLRVPFTDDIVGNFMVHCHLLEHEDNGMMMAVQVWEGEIPAAVAGAVAKETPAMPMHGTAGRQLE